MPSKNICDWAKRAKMRMMKNDYENEARGIDNCECLATFLSHHQKSEKKKEPSPPSTYAQNEEMMYKKVCEILDSGNVANPVSLLIDHEIFNSLDREAKQFYIYNLTQKFNYLKNRYFKTHLSKYII